MRKLLVLILSVVAVYMGSSCAPSRPTIKEVRLPPERIHQNGYSILPLDEPGWFIGYRDSEKLLLGKQGSNPDENFVIRAFLQILPPLRSDEEFIGFAKSVLIAEGASRHRVLSQETKILSVRGKSCVRTDTVIEDHGAVKQSLRSESMILEASALLCKHPNNTTAILVAYSHRYYAGNAEREASTKAQRILDSLEFSEL